MPDIPMPDLSASDPRAPLGFRIPFNAESGEVIEERWRQWRRHDPSILSHNTRMI